MPAKRKYGYYVLPLLQGERFIGYVEPVWDRKTGVISVRGLCYEPDIKPGKRLVASVDMALARLTISKSEGKGLKAAGNTPVARNIFLSYAGKGSNDDEVLARGEGATVAGQVNRNSLQFLRLAQTAQRRHRVPLRNQWLERIRVKRELRADITRTDGIDTYVMLRPFNRQRLG